MKERELRDLIADVKTGRLSRRWLCPTDDRRRPDGADGRMMLSQSCVAMAATAIPYKPTKAGGGGPLKLLFWQAVTLLNPHFAVGTKDQEGSRIFTSRWRDGTMTAIWSPSWPPRFRARRMMDWLKTAAR